VKFYFAVFFYLFIFKISAQNVFHTRYDMALSAEIGGISPFFSANFEFVPLKTKTSFLNVRAGAGYISSTSQGISVPVSLTYNRLIKQKTICDARPKSSFKETFVEIGLGASYITVLGEKPKIYYAPIIGIRRQISKWGSSNVFFYKIQITPIYTEKHFKFAAGLSIAQSI
jgi:hypothetical protein